MSGTVYTVASGKGGVGKTTTAVNLAVAMWREGNTVAVVDGDLGMANLAPVLGLEPSVTIHDVLAGEAALDDAIVEAKDGDLVVVPGEHDLAGFARADPAELRSVLADLAERYDHVIVDTGAGLSYEDVLPLGLADEVLLVTTPEAAAIGDTRKTLQLSGLLKGSIRGVVVTRAVDGTDPAAVADEVGVELLGAIPEDPAVVESTAAGAPLESHAPNAPATGAYRDLAATISGRADRSADVDVTRGGDSGSRGDDGAGPEAANETAAADDGESKDPETTAAERATTQSGEAASSDGDADRAGHDRSASADADAPDESASGGEPDADEDEPEPDKSPSAADGSGDAPDERPDAEPAAADRDSAAGNGGESRRGGLFGWLGRRFS